MRVAREWLNSYFSFEIIFVNICLDILPHDYLILATAGCNLKSGHPRVLQFSFQFIRH